MIRVTKVKLRPTPFSVTIHYKELNSQQKWDDKQITSSDQPLPSFLKSMQDMAPHLIENCELPDELKVNTTVTGLKVTWHDKEKIETPSDIERAKQDLGCVIIGIRGTKLAVDNITLTSPQKKIIDTSNEQYQLSEECVYALHRVVTEAERYIHGERSQADLFEDQRVKD